MIQFELPIDRACFEEALAVAQEQPLEDRKPDRDDEYLGKQNAGWQGNLRP